MCTVIFLLFILLYPINSCNYFDYFVFQEIYCWWNLRRNPIQNCSDVGPTNLVVKSFWFAPSEFDWSTYIPKQSSSQPKPIYFYLCHCCHKSDQGISKNLTNYFCFSIQMSICEWALQTNDHLFSVMFKNRILQGELTSYSTFSL